MGKSHDLMDRELRIRGRAEHFSRDRFRVRISEEIDTALRGGEEEYAGEAELS